MMLIHGSIIGRCISIDILVETRWIVIILADTMEVRLNAELYWLIDIYLSTLSSSQL